MAANKVFDVPELLEHILLELAHTSLENTPPALPLFPIQRVNKTSRNTIRSSVTLQRRMFLRQSGTTDDTSEDYVAAISWFHKFIGIYCSMAMDSNTVTIEAEIPKGFASSQGEGGKILNSFEAHHGGLGYPDASWRQIFADPTGPTRNLELEIDLCLRDPSLISRDPVRDLGSGVTLGLIYEKYVEILKVMSKYEAKRKESKKRRKAESAVIKSLKAQHLARWEAKESKIMGAMMRKMEKLT